MTRDEASVYLRYRLYFKNKQDEKSKLFKMLSLTRFKGEGEHPSYTCSSPGLSSVGTSLGSICKSVRWTSDECREGEQKVLLPARDACRLRYTSRWGGCQNSAAAEGEGLPKMLGVAKRISAQTTWAGGLGRKRKAWRQAVSGSRLGFMSCTRSQRCTKSSSSVTSDEPGAPEHPGCGEGRVTAAKANKWWKECV